MRGRVGLAGGQQKRKWSLLEVAGVGGRWFKWAKELKRVVGLSARVVGRVRAGNK